MAVRKFITAAPRQNVIPGTGAGGAGEAYEAIENSRLDYPESVSFPVMNMIHGYVEPGDQVVVLVITADYGHCIENFRYIDADAHRICEEIGAECQVKRIDIEFNESIENHLGIFEKLIENIHDDDILYACITYGSKPAPILEIMALNYGYRTCRNVLIGCIVYGEMDHDTKKKRIYDVTSLFLMDQIVNELGQYQHHDPLGVIRSLLRNSEE